MAKKWRHKNKAIEIGNKFKARSCNQKKKFSEFAAEEIAIKYGQREYECDFCGYWHLTSNVGEK